MMAKLIKLTNVITGTQQTTLKNRAVAEMAGCRTASVAVVEAVMEIRFLPNA